MNTAEENVNDNLIIPDKFENIAGKIVNRIVIGTARVAAEKLGDGTIVPKRDNDEREIELLNYCIGRGLNFIDTAHGYGGSEEVVGLFIRNVNRDSILIATKVGQKPVKPDEIRRSINESVERLGTAPDVLFAHDRWEGLMEKEMEACLKELDHAVDSGLAKGIGISNFRPDELEWASKIVNHKILAYQGKLNLVNSRRDGLQLLQVCRKLQIPFMASSALDRGKILGLSGQTEISRISEKYGMSIPQLGIFSLLTAGVLPIVQSHHEEHIDENLDVFKYAISKDDNLILQNILFPDGKN